MLATNFGTKEKIQEDGQFDVSIVKNCHDELSHGRKITFRIRSMLAKQVGYNRVYRRAASYENNKEEAPPSMPMSCL